MSVTVVINRAAVAHLVSDPNGPIGIKLRSQATRVRDTAKKLCPVRSGYLQSSIVATSGAKINRRVVTWRVGTNVRYARFVHNGTRYMKGTPFLTQALRLETSK